MAASVTATLRASRRLAPLLRNTQNEFLSSTNGISTVPKERTFSAATTTPVESIPVVISGGGPVGLTTAQYLSNYGVPSIILERSPELTTHPRAHFINHRTMEVFRGMAGLSSDVEAAMPPLRQWRNFIYCTELNGGTLLGIVDHFKGQTSPLVPYYSPEPVAHLAQHKLLPMLAQRAAAAPGVDLRMGHRVTGLVHHGSDSVRVQVESENGKSKYEIKAQYLVAADGAHSGIRQALGIPMVGPGPMQHLINIHFISPKLGEELKLYDRQGMLYFIFGPGVIAVMVAHNLDTGEFVAQVPYFPPLQSPDDFTPEACAAIVRRAAGDASLPLQLKTIRPWAMSAATAEKYLSGRVILAGDAAHVVPPSGALGMNTGVQDAHNIAWKLALTVTGAAPHSLLETYGAERRPVAEANMRLSVANFHEALTVAKVMGLDFRVANSFSDVLSSKALSLLPERLRRGVLDAGIAAGQAVSAPLAALRRSELDALFNHGDTLRLQYPKEDLGFVYRKGAAVKYEPGDAEAVATYVGPKPRDAPYEPSTLPGARFPHFELQFLQPGALLHFSKQSMQQSGEIIDGRRSLNRDMDMISSIDLWPAAGLRFVLLLSPSKDLEDWLSAVANYNEEAAEEEGFGVRICPVVIVGNSEANKESNLIMEVHKDVAIAVVEDSNRWEELRGVTAEGGILVRPDGHVGWRGVSYGNKNKSDVLRDVMASLLRLHENKNAREG